MIESNFEKQRDFFMSGATLPLKFRRDALLRLRAALREREGALAAALRDDLGKCPAESYMCEIGLSLSSLTDTLRHLRQWAAGRRVPTPLSQFPGSSHIVPEPFGVALIISPWNYPLLLSIDPLISALAAGNCCTLRFSRNAPHTAAALSSLIAATFPPELVTTVHGGTEDAEKLLDLPFDKILFTGSPNVGKKVMQAAAAHLTPVTLELGGKSPCIVDQTSPLPLAARRIAFGKTLNSGQTCVAPDYLLIHSSVKDSFVREFRKSVQEMFDSHPERNENFPHIINERHFNRLLHLMEGGKILFGGESDPATLRIAPTLLDDITPDSPCMQEEIFGPILPIITYEDIAEAESFVRSRPKPLACYIFTRDRARERRLLSSISAGGFCVNDTIVHLAVHSLPFGGVGNSGMGAYHGRTGFDTFSHAKPILRRSMLLDFPFRYAPLNCWKQRILRFFLK